MKILIISFLLLWTMASSQKEGDTNMSAEIKPKSISYDVRKLVKLEIDKLAETVKFIKSSIAPNCIEPPKECPNANITFWYYSRLNPTTPIEISISNLASVVSPSESKSPWKVIIHGYTKSKNDIPNPQLRTAYFKKGEYNLISVDYAPLARNNCYIQAVANVPLVANCTAQMIDALIERQWFNSNDLHIIGFSLGAHIAGLVNTFMKHPKPNRVTGLDPASPLFDGFLHSKLNSSAGEFVDVIHTNALLKGKLEISGHIDFYPNGGFNQPGCQNKSEESFSTCSHERSPLYFAESINSEVGFYGIKCSGYLKFYSGLCNTNKTMLVLMGEYVPRNARGAYYLRTSDKPPFALGKMTSPANDLKKYARSLLNLHKLYFFILLLPIVIFRIAVRVLIVSYLRQF